MIGVFRLKCSPFPCTLEPVARVGGDTRIPTLSDLDEIELWDKITGLFESFYEGFEIQIELAVAMDDDVVRCSLFLFEVDVQEILDDVDDIVNLECFSVLQRRRL
ncbi:hypothetical protein C475_22254 [Halosimplex carlsbadense 2-9-1]|uniref:Uncharacterized protein n=1 Tax=Halosimplex carlsbadense 2-9-1 TaxID=797114 RepID=M0CCU4_9EURY|nr:hypothetical protein C475_22254 [Halosimplex carlsbadense 2-9-1]